MPLEIKCEKCNGTGYVPYEYETYEGAKKKKLVKKMSDRKCDNCLGKRTIITEEGHALLGFLHRHDWQLRDEVYNLREDLRSLEIRTDPHCGC